ncbi:GAF domain-containing sensor histidine kinase [Candidatus Chloroploca sp. M-50]|uniref:GAF domain-containing sensor histidine kinase n=1 Tax=Candidatus Chloroploca mongolica TaxID=2528176 RepID=A0ABS4DAH3_9CHLR|nr:GAF domain-containing sensor histidine kinase [Candidatus Chloroploca mongolica]MBP1466430.1 GAF domain-containing sensor histidine kinase [Candidatus Chloroploca mongolica]
MSPIALNQRHLETLSQLLIAGGHQGVSELLASSLERLIAFWPAQAGALLYANPYGDLLKLEHGPLNDEARTLIDQARHGFGRREEGSEPIVGSYSLDDGHDLIELPLRSGGQGVGLLHLVVDQQSALDSATGGSSLDEELLVLLVRAIGGEADKIAMLRRAERDLRELNLLYEIGQSLAVNLDLNSLLNDIKLRAPKVVGAERCSIFMLDEERNELVLDLPGEAKQYRMPADKGIVGWVTTHGVGQVVNDVEQDTRWYDAIGREAEFITRSILCVPMRLKDRTIGAMQLLNTIDGRPFTDQDMQLLTTLAAQAAIAIENARLYQSLKQEHERILTKEADVRHAIARDLHDGPTQSIAAIAMNIEFIKKLFKAMPERLPDELDTLAELVNKTTHDIRTLLFELRPLGLETQGLVKTLEQYVERWRDPSGAETRLRLEAPSNMPRLPAEREAAAFIIIQEATTNARKHAHSDIITIYLYMEEDTFVASVRDRGRGFNVASVENSYNIRGSLGLLNMKERARLIGADLRIRSELTRGTTVELRIPLS